MTLECDAAVVISYTELLEEEDKSLLYPRLIDAFASSNSSLGLLIISDLPPAFAEPRHKLLHYSNTFAALDESIKDKYVSPPTYSFGWSHGKEMMAGLPDVHKGSYYANTCDDARNVWPDVEAGCEGFQRVFKDLCSLMVGVGERIASLCDGALRIDAREGVATKGIAQLIGESKQSKARLLHYVRLSYASWHLRLTSSFGAVPTCRSVTIARITVADRSTSGGGCLGFLVRPRRFVSLLPFASY